MKRICLFTIVTFCLCFVERVQACDLCAVYSSVSAESPKAGTFPVSIAEQFTGFDRVQEDGHKIDNSDHQHLESSITQIVGVYEAADNFQFQISLPYINRRFSRVNDGVSEKGTEAGIGDLSLLGRMFPYQYSDGQRSLITRVFAGIKLPTGDADRLREEQSESDLEDTHLRHGDEHHDDEVPGAIHGHDLALGSGSVDFPVGAGFFGQWDRYFASSDLQYSIRTEGDHNYHYANDLIWNAGPGAYLVLNDEAQIALRATLSGEYKRNDSGHADTAVNSLFLGPELLATIQGQLLANIALDLPLDIKNSGVQAVPSYRIRAALTYRF
jgi:hypothetical protein